MKNTQTIENNTKTEQTVAPEVENKQVVYSASSDIFASLNLARIQEGQEFAIDDCV